MTQTQLGFGDHLFLAVRNAGGLAPVSRAINAVMGIQAPARATYQQLFTVQRVEDLNPKQRFLTLLVLVACGQDPEEWLDTPVDLPLMFDLVKFRKLVRRQGLEPRTRWFRAETGEDEPEPSEESDYETNERLAG